jgi:hypothetical protein
LSALCLSSALCGCNRPYILIRPTAAKAIEATAEFQHKTKLYFEINLTLPAQNVSLSKLF